MSASIPGSQMVKLKSEQDIEKMRQAGRIVGQTLLELAEAIRPDVTTAQDLDTLAEKRIREAGAVPSFKGYRGYPKSICCSVNEQVVHGIPSDRLLRSGDIVSLDLGVKLNGFHADAALTVGVGAISDEAERLMRVTQEALECGIQMARPGCHLMDISSAIQQHAESHGYSIVRDLVGHGIGRDLHEDPQVPNYGVPGAGLPLADGMTLAIEPMVNEGTYKVKSLSDQWTVVTADGKMSAHFEHTVAIRKDGPDVLTLPA